ncbi:MAG: MBOAT family protein [Clostridia bacterium]|nr:MBOAT family protein [Clostridia bacterium]
MLFSSIPFLYAFLPIVLLLYFISPRKLKNTVLLISSLVFYAWGEPRYVFIMIISVTCGYVLGLLIEKYRDKKRLSRLFMILSAVISLGLLGYFKYANFFISNFAAVTGLSIPLLRITLPIGISFYTFQLLSYTIDVYRGNVPAQKNFITLSAYIALFPQLIAGPIVRYSDVAEELQSRTHSFKMVAEGSRRFLIGLGKKVLIANVLGEFCDTFKASGDWSVAFFWLYGIAFSLHIYFDFSGYSDMAIGLGRILGFNFLENFNYPFISKSITEFWRRWHMSLSYWFRDYVYIPLGGNRVSKARHIFNIFVVWFLTGFWHGADWYFIIWGVYFGVLLLIEKFFLSDLLKKAKFVRHIYVLFLIIISFVIFNASSTTEAFAYVGRMFGAGGLPLVSDEFFYYLRSLAPTLAIAIIGATPVVKTAFTRLSEREGVRRILNIVEIPALLLLLIVITAYLVDGSFNPFLYFRF